MLVICGLTMRIIQKKSTNYNGTGLPGTNVYSRTNKVFGLSADYSF